MAWTAFTLAVALSSMVVAQSKPPLDQACQRSATRIARQLGEGHVIAVHEPYIIAGNLSAEEVERWWSQTIRPAHQAMQAEYCDTPPDEPVTILLFADEASYRAAARRLFGDKDVSVYGYYRPHGRTLVMNIATGGGTLVHELTHALTDFDFPSMPDWLDEGLASLHEQCRFRANGKGIEGLENWRLPALQEAIRRNELRSLQSLVAANDFRGPREGLNYAQARYLCLWLQQQGLLGRLYRECRASRAEDRLGEATLHKLLGRRPWSEIDRDYRAFVQKLAWEAS